MELKVGDVVTTYASDQAIILNVEDDYAVLIQNNEYVIANGYSEYEGKLVWDHGNYFGDFNSLSEYLTRSRLAKDHLKIKSFLLDLGQDNYENLVKGFMAYDLNIENEYALDSAYKEHMKYGDYINFDQANTFIDDKVRDVVMEYARVLIETMEEIDHYEFSDQLTKPKDDICFEYFLNIIKNEKEDILNGLDNLIGEYNDNKEVVKKLEVLREDLKSDNFDYYKKSKDKDYER